MAREQQCTEDRFLKDAGSHRRGRKCSDSMSTEYKVGHKFWWVGSDNKLTQREVTVTKVGRLWLTLSNGHRVDKTTLVADAGQGTSPGDCWESKAAFDEHASIVKAWSALQRKVSVSWRVPDNVTLEDIKAAAAHLKLEIKA